ncbi:MAG: hypothetical protein AB1656_01270 [Candidatus Omnitrophota bacterium]
MEAKIVISSVKEDRKRFLREGILDEIIKRMRHWDKHAWTINRPFYPSFSTIISLFESNRHALQSVEKLIEEMRRSEEPDQEKLIRAASFIQMGLWNAFEGLEEEWSQVIAEASRVKESTE